MNLIPLSLKTPADEDLYSIRHIPVMANEVVRFLMEISPQVVIDGTCGSGGHAHSILSAIDSIKRYICIDWDDMAIQISQERLSQFKEKVDFIRSNFKNIPQLIREHGINKADAVILDLGLSSMQLEMSGRGFSFRRDEPVDMRMDDSDPTTALDLIKSLSVDQLSQIIREYGEERWAKRIAHSIKEYCKNEPMPTSKGLASAICMAIPRRFHPKKIHPATKTFQAIRIALNREMDNLKRALEELPDILRRGGRFIVISFHSIEDRMVKHAFKEDNRLKPLTKRPVTPQDAEIVLNSRSRSAKLRCAEKIF